MSTATIARPRASRAAEEVERHEAAAPTATRHAVRLEAIGTSPDGVVEEVGGLYDGRGWAAHSTGRPFSYRYTAVGDDAVTLRRSRITGAIRGAIPHTDDYIVQWLTEGVGVPDVRHDRVPLTTGVPMLFPTDREFVFEYQDYDQRIVHLSRSLVHDVAEERYRTGPVDDLALDHLRTLDPAAVARWRGQVTLLARELRNGVGTLLWQTLTRDAAAAFLALYPPALPEIPEVVLLPRLSRLRAAVEFVHEHVHEPLTVGDIARAADLSVRSVQETFQRHLDCSPMTYLLRVRLARVRIELLRADPGTTTVQDVARRWGFAHLGRFSGTYAQAYGEYPRQTLRR
ncbi:helix-turn-helix domain-containing protein [Curtobacterium sp. MCSS17_008]|uniref:helix-turn-helix transcriptional regulator n=1 Tax=Curtobacterium sp. MCSS17_008 TaxID=2175647 RepID=UPI0011B5A00E|nr:helix-turn-helix domain-containing protein [Curtobacterium sp. MCSS17_008]